MNRSGNLYTVGFAAVVCLVCSALVCLSVVLLRDRQEENVLLARQLNVLAVSGLVEEGAKPAADEIRKLYEGHVRRRIVDLESGQYADDAAGPEYDMVEACRLPATSQRAPANGAGLNRMPKHAVVFEVVNQGRVDMFILPVWGQGLWSTMLGYLAMDRDGRTIRGITFYEQGETPGLGGEVDNPKWKAAWKGRAAYDAEGKPAMAMRKGGAGPVEEDPHGFDAISGATITSRAVQDLVNLWLGDSGYGPFLKAVSNR